MSDALHIRAIQSTLDLERTLAARNVKALAETQQLLRHLVTAATSEALNSGNDAEAARADAALASAIFAAQVALGIAPAPTDGGA